MEKGAEYEKKCKEMELEYYKKKLMKEDREFFAYADEVLELAQSRGRSIEPIIKVVQVNIEYGYYKLYFQQL